MPAIEPLWAPDTSTREAKAAGWKKVGELDDGRPIWEAEFEEKVGEEPLVVAGKPQWVMVGAEPVKPKMVKVMAKVKRQFVEEKQPNGGKFKNFNFQPDPEEQARAERRQKVDTFQRTLAERMVDEDLSVDDLLGAIGSIGAGGEDKPRRGRRA